MMYISKYQSSFTEYEHYKTVTHTYHIGSKGDKIAWITSWFSEFSFEYRLTCMYAKHDVHKFWSVSIGVSELFKALVSFRIVRKEFCSNQSEDTILSILNNIKRDFY